MIVLLAQGTAAVGITAFEWPDATAKQADGCASL